MRAVALLVLLFAAVALDARADVQVSGSFAAQFSNEFDTATFSCTGAPLCTGVLAFTQRHQGCSNPDTFNFGLTITGLTLTQPGNISGNFVVGGVTDHTNNSDGTCTYTHRTTNDTFAYAGTWDGTGGKFTFLVPDGDQPGAALIPVNVTFTASGLTPPPIFQMVVSSNFTPTTVSVSVTFVPKPQDIGTTQSVFAFFYVPQSLLAGKSLKDGPDPCVLAQIGPNGQLIGATASTLTPIITGVLGAQGTTVGILNGVNTTNVAGASAYIGYGPNPGSMFANGTYQGIVNIPGATQCNTNIATRASASLPGALTGLYWNAAESGWGVHFTQRGSNVFAAWYTYDSAGNPKWYVATCSGFTGTSGTCNGTVFEVTGPNFFGGAFNPSLVNASSAGTLTLTFSSANAASMTYSVADVTRTVTLTRQPLGGGTAVPAVDFSDIWWGGAAESGWGMAIAQQSGITFLAWYVYDANGKPTWLVATCTMSGNVGTGQLFRTTGPAFGPTFDSTRVAATQAGTVTVTFTDPNNALLDYTVDGVSGHKAITRQLF